MVELSNSEVISYTVTRLLRETTNANLSIWE